MFSSIKYLFILATIGLVAFALWYVTNLKADLAISQENAKKMIAAVEQQNQAIKQMKEEQAAIQKINEELNSTIVKQNKDLKSLENRFTMSSNGQTRDFGKLAEEKPKSIERAINRGTVNAFRCIEIATGSPLTEKELNAKTETEINKECPSLANPNYKK